MPQVYLDEQGEPIQAGVVYLDDNGNPIGGAPSKSLGGFVRNIGTSGVDAVKDAASMVDPRNWGGMVKTISAQHTAANADFMRGVDAVKRGESPFKDVGKNLRERMSGVAAAAYENPVGTAMALIPGARPAVGLRAVKSGFQAIGKRFVRGALKPDTTNLRKMAGSSQAGIDKMADQVTETALREGVNPMTKRGLNTVQRRADALNTVRDTDIAAAPQVPMLGSGRRQLTSLRPVAEKYGGRRQSTPQADMREIQTFAKDLKANPDITTRGPGRTRPMRDLTPDELNQLNKGDNRALSGKFGKVGDAEIDARKAVVGSRRDMLDEAVPGTKDIGRRLKDLIDLRNVSNVARKRGEGRDGLGLTDLIALSSGRPETLLLSTAMRPAAQAGIGGALHRTGAVLPSQIDLTALYRAALLAQLSQPEGP